MIQSKVDLIDDDLLVFVLLTFIGKACFTVVDFDSSELRILKTIVDSAQINRQRLGFTGLQWARSDQFIG